MSGIPVGENEFEALLGGDGQNYMDVDGGADDALDNSEVEALLDPKPDDEEEFHAPGAKPAAKKAGSPAPDGGALDPITEMLRQDLEQRQRDNQARQLDFQRRQEEERRQEREAAAQRRREQIEASLKAYAPQGLDQTKLTDEEMKVYGQSRAVIDKIARSQVAGLWEGTLSPALRTLLERQAEVDEQLTSLRQATEQRQNPAVLLDERIRMNIPDIDAITQSAQFAAFRNEDVPGAAGFRYGDLISSAYQAGDVMRITNLIKTFKDRQQKGAPRRESASPAPHAASPQTRRQNEPRVSISKLDAAYDRYRNGAMSREQLAKIERLYEDKAAKGLVDYNS